MKSRFVGLLPPRTASLWRLLRDRWELGKLRTQRCDDNRLGDLAKVDLDGAFSGPTVESEWRVIERQLTELGISDRAGGVNPGDRRALFHLTRYLAPQSLLEIGTHLGASTIHLATAMKLGSEAPLRLVTVDIRVVNDSRTKPWIIHGSRYSPLEMARRLECDQFVAFVTGDSQRFLAECNEVFDLIFLDGDHSAATVYRELPAAMGVLRPGGYVLLHDYFPEHRPLWPEKAVLPGPYLAVRRLQAEGVNIEALPLGELPWPTKLDSRVTSLALAGRG